MLVTRKVLIFCVFSVSLAAWCASTATAQRRGGGPGGFGGGGPGGQAGGRFGGGAPGAFGGFGGGGSLLDLLSRNDVGAELELIDSQKEQIKALQEEQSQQRDQQRQQMRDRMGQLRDATDDQRRQLFEELRSTAQSSAEAVQGKLKLILLPHQTLRLEQLAYQIQIRRSRERALASGPLAEKLGVTDQQREQLQQKRQEAEQAYLNVYLGVLTSAQQSQYQALVGKPFEFQDEGSQQGSAGGGFGRNRSAGSAPRGAPGQTGRGNRRGGAQNP